MNETIDWNAQTLSEVVIKHYEALSPSDKGTLHAICLRAVRKALIQRKPEPATV